jgi:hypothetical protein
MKARSHLDCRRPNRVGSPPDRGLEHLRSSRARYSAGAKLIYLGCACSLIHSAALCDWREPDRRRKTIHTGIALAWSQLPTGFSCAGRIGKAGSKSSINHCACVSGYTSHSHDNIWQSSRHQPRDTPTRSIAPRGRGAFFLPTLTCCTARTDWNITD